MKAQQLYERLEKDFILPGITDEWYTYMTELAPFICDNFKKRSMGVMCDFTDKIEKVYTAVFPSEKVLKTVLDNAKNAMIFLHHASDWDLKK